MVPEAPGIPAGTAAASAGRRSAPLVGAPPAVDPQAGALAQQAVANAALMTANQAQQRMEGAKQLLTSATSVDCSAVRRGRRKGIHVHQLAMIM